MNLSSAKTMTAGLRYFRQTGLPDLWIRTAASPETGFGHLRRSLVLAEALRDFCRPIFLLDPDDRWSNAQVEERNWDSLNGSMDRAWEILPEPAAILIDTRLSTGLSDLIARAGSHGIPVISIHDLGLNRLPSDKSIDGSIVPMRPDPACPRTQYFCGTNYMVLDPVYRTLFLQHKPIRDRIRSVFVNLGGGNSGQFYWKVLEALKLWGREADVVGVPGFASWGQEKLSQRDWSPVHFRWESRNIERQLFSADLAITAGGISAYEAMCAGTPLLALSYDPLQQITITGLSQAGGCVDLGPGDALVPGELAARLSEIDRDAAARHLLSRNGRQLVDGRGAERVAGLIRQTVSGNLWQKDAIVHD